MDTAGGPSTGTDSTLNAIGCSWERNSSKHVHRRGLVTCKGENPMKILISTFAMAVALAFTGPAFAGDVSKAKTEADCQKHGGIWDAKTNICSDKKM